MGNLIDLSKKARIVLEKKQIEYVQAEIILALDVSGSMSFLFENGTVQKVVDRLLAIGMNIDVNKSIEVFAFNNQGRSIGVATEDNHNGFVEDRIADRVQGGTSYAPVMNLITKEAGYGKVEAPPEEKLSFFQRLRGKKQPEHPNVSTVAQKPAQHPTLVFFLTDGENDDHNAARRMIQGTSKYPIFWQFVGIGDEEFEFLQELDEMEGRFIDNANFFQVNDIAKISDEELYDRILNEFPMWLKEAKQKGLLIE